MVAWVLLPLALGTGTALGLYFVDPQFIVPVIAASAIAPILVIEPRFALGIAVALNGLVFVEPAPVDVTMALLFLWVVASGRLSASTVSRIPTPIVIGACLLILANVLSLLSSAHVQASLTFAAVTFYCVATALTIVAVTDTDRNMQAVVLGYVGGALLFAALGLAAFDGILAERQLYGSFRLVGLFKDPNVFGPYLVPAWLVAFHWLGPSWRRGIVSTAALLVIGVAIILSFSRGAWLNAAVAIIVYCIASARSMNRVQAAALLALGFGSVTAVAWLTESNAASTISQWFSERLALQTYDAARFEAQLIGLGIASQAPLGIGPGEYPYWAGIASHNLYIRVLAENGVLGLLGILLIAVGVIRSLFRAAGRTMASNDVVNAKLALGIVAGLAVNSAFVDTLHWRHLWLFLGISVALYMFSLQRKDVSAVGMPRLSAVERYPAC